MIIIRNQNSIPQKWSREKELFRTALGRSHRRWSQNQNPAIVWDTSLSPHECSVSQGKCYPAHLTDDETELRKHLGPGGCQVLMDKPRRKLQKTQDYTCREVKNGHWSWSCIGCIMLSLKFFAWLLVLKTQLGAPEWLSWLSVRLQLRSWSHWSWVRALCRALCWQLGARSLLRILCLPLSLSAPPLLKLTLSLSLSLSLSLLKINSRGKILKINK